MQDRNNSGYLGVVATNQKELDGTTSTSVDPRNQVVCRGRRREASVLKAEHVTKNLALPVVVPANQVWENQAKDGFGVLKAETTSSLAGF